MKFLIFAVLLLTACAPNSLEDFQQEGQARCHKLTAQLKKIETRDQLSKAAAQLQKRFEDLVDLMIEARRYQIAHPQEETPEILDYQSESNAELVAELKRIYRLEGARDLVEKTQHEALIRLDAFERTVSKQKEILPK